MESLRSADFVLVRLTISMDQISKKTPIPKCHLYWCLIEFSQSCWYFQPLLWTSASLVFSLVHLPSLPPFPVWVSTGARIHTVCNRWGGGDQVVWRAYPGVIHLGYLARFWTYKIALPPQTKTWEGKGPQTDKHLPPITYTGQFLRKAAVWGVWWYLVHDY